MLPKDHFVSTFLYFTTADVKSCVAAVKRCPVLHFSVVIFFWSFGIIDASTIKCWKLSTAQAGARGRVGCCTIHLSTCADSIKPSVKFSCNFVVINASEGSSCFKIFMWDSAGFYQLLIIYHLVINLSVLTCALSCFCLGSARLHATGFCCWVIWGLRSSESINTKHFILL
jgi:hypothetical protein